MRQKVLFITWSMLLALLDFAFQEFFLFLLCFHLFPGGELLLLLLASYRGVVGGSRSLTCYLVEFFFLLVSLVELSWIKRTEYSFSLLPRHFPVLFGCDHAVLPL